VALKNEMQCNMAIQLIWQGNLNIAISSAVGRHYLPSGHI